MLLWQRPVNTMKATFIFIDCRRHFSYFSFDTGTTPSDNITHIKRLIFDVKRNSEFYLLLRAGRLKIRTMTKAKECFDRHKISLDAKHSLNDDDGSLR